MGPTPLIFVSTTSRDLVTARREISEILRKAACRAVVMEDFPPEYGTACEMLKREISKSDAVIHVAGLRFGSMPDGQSDNIRSYTQIEYECALQLKKRVFVFLLPEDFPYDPCQPEESQFEEAQAAHRAALAQLDNRNTAQTVAELSTKVALIGGRVRWQGALKYVAKRVAVATLAIILLSAVGYLTWRLWLAGLQFQRMRENLVAMTRNIAGKGTSPDQEIGNYAKKLGVSPGEAAAEIRLALARAQMTYHPDALARPLASYFDNRYAEAAKQAEDAAVGFEKRMPADNPKYPVYRKEALEAYRLAADAYRLVDRRADELRNRDKVFALLGGPPPYEPPAASRAEWLEAASRLSWVRWLTGDLAAARMLADTTVEAFDKWSQQGADSANQLTSLLRRELLNTRSLIARSQGDWSVFLADSELLFHSARTELGDDDPRTLVASNNLAIAYAANGMLQKSSDLEEWTIKGLERTLPPEDPSTLQTKLNHAATLQELKQYEAALALHDALLEPLERVSGKAHPATLNNRHNRANTLMLLGRLAEADSAHRKLLADRLDALGAGNMDTWKSKLSLAEVLRRRKSYAEAAVLVDEVINVCGSDSVAATPECQHAGKLRNLIRRDSDANK